MKTYQDVSMDNRELFNILENQGPWTIRFQDSLGKIFFSNEKVIIQVELTVEEAMDSAPSVKWNGTLSEDNADSDDEQATEPETKQPAREPNLWANVPEVISLDELRLFRHRYHRRYHRRLASKLDED